MNRIVLLGTGGGPVAPPQGVALPGTSALLDLDGRSIVIDAGPGVVSALLRAGADLKRIDTICITHLHAGHMLELGALVHAVWTAGRTEPLALWGPPGIQPCWQGFLAAMAFDTALRSREMKRPLLADLVVVGHLQQGVVQDGAVSIHALSVPHPPVEYAFALRFDGTKSVTFSGDTAYFPPLAAFARTSDVLVHSAFLPGQIEAMAAERPPDNPWAKARDAIELAHTSVGQAGRIAQTAKVKRLVLHHLIPGPGTTEAPAIWAERVKERWSGPVIVGHDGLEVPL